MKNSQKENALKPITLTTQARNVIKQLSKSNKSLDKRTLAIFQRFVLCYNFEPLVQKLRKDLAIDTPKYQQLPTNKKIQELLDSDMLIDVLLDFDISNYDRLGRKKLKIPQPIPQKEIADEFLKQTFDFVHLISTAMFWDKPDKLQASGMFFNNFALGILHEYIFFGELKYFYKYNLGTTSFNAFPLETFTTEEIRAGQIDVTVDISAWKDLSISLPQDVRKEEAIAYIDAIWTIVERERARNKDLTTNTRFRLHKNFLRDVAIFNMYITILQQPKDKRREISGSVTNYPETHTTKALQRDEFKALLPPDTVISDEITRTAYKKMRKEIKIINHI